MFQFILKFFDKERSLLKKEISELKTEVKLTRNLKDLENSLLNKVKLAKKQERLKIYKEERQEKVLNNELYIFRGIEIDVIPETRNLFNLFGLLRKPYNTFVQYFAKDYTLRFLGISEHINKTIDIFKREKYIINDLETETTGKLRKNTRFFYKGRRMLFLNPDSPIDLDFNMKTGDFFADAETTHSLINNVVDYKLTMPTQTTGGILEFIKKYIWLIVILIVLYILYQNGVFNSLFATKLS